MTLKINRPDVCHSCSASGSCGTGILTNYFNTTAVFNQPTQNNVSIGDFITLEISSKELFSRAFLFYIFPILALFVGGYMGMIFFPTTELWHIGFGLTGLIATLTWVKYFVK